MGIFDFFRRGRNRESLPEVNPVRIDELGRLCVPTVLDGRFRIEKVLGQGGFGITYLATDIKKSSEVAIKEFYPKKICERDAATGMVRTDSKNWGDTITDLKRKFLKEARNIERFNHPYVISGKEEFEDNGTAYYVMDFVKGRTLYQIVTANGPLAPEKALEYIVKTGMGLEYIHSLRMTHLDIKPQNIMVRDSDDSPVLIDFGISKHYDEEGHNTTISDPGRSSGYSPVEQYYEKGLETFSPQTDVYSLGATLYFLLLGKKPPEANLLISEELFFPPSFPKEFISPIVKAMRPNKKERFPTMHDFLETLQPGYRTKYRLPEMYDIKMDFMISGTITVKWHDMAGKELKYDKETVELKAWAVTYGVSYSVSYNGKERSVTRLLTQNEWSKLYDDLTSYLDERTECRKGYSVTTPCFDIFFRNKTHSLNHVLWVSTDKDTKVVSSNRLDTGKFRNVAEMWDFFVRKIPMLDEMRRSLATESERPRQIAGDDTELAPQQGQRKLTGTINGHEWVDLGLPSGTKWATCNVGASTPEEYGDYFAWGETGTKNSYDLDNSLTDCKSIYELQPAGIIGSDWNLTLTHDAARTNWGGSWRMPTKGECEELVDKCRWTWTSQGGYKGYKVTGPNGKSIFLPAAGYRFGTSLLYAGEYGYYWSSTPEGVDLFHAFRLLFHSSRHLVDWDYRYYGQSVRPVSE